jgi:hypothetical protein
VRFIASSPLSNRDMLMHIAYMHKQTKFLDVIKEECERVVMDYNDNLFGGDKG